MSFFKEDCKHEWATVKETKAAPAEVPTDDHYTYEYEERWHRGFVTLLRVCNKCGEQTVFELLGV